MQLRTDAGEPVDDPAGLVMLQIGSKSKRNAFCFRWKNESFRSNKSKDLLEICTNYVMIIFVGIGTRT